MSIDLEYKLEKLNDALLTYRDWIKKPDSIDAPLFIFNDLEELLREGIVPGTEGTMEYDTVHNRTDSKFFIILEDMYKQCYDNKGRLQRIGRESTEKLKKIEAATGTEKEDLVRQFLVWQGLNYVKVPYQDKPVFVLPGCYILSQVRKGSHYHSSEDIPKWIATIQELQEKIPAFVKNYRLDMPPLEPN
ncbi:MAG TPA: hypothetical protein VKE88_00440 [Candidatus Nanoarchaeia archaeon]|nr:hypothetical protein [Candidatus Nanoarchaeia archaeon]